MSDRTSAWLDAPPAFQPHVREAGQFDWAGTTHRFLVLDRQLQSPRCFCGLDRRSGWLYISDEVQLEYRPPMLYHEVFEQYDFQGHEYACGEALKKELLHLEGLDRRAYMEDFRLGVLRDLGRHVHDRRWSDQYHPAYRYDVSLAYTYLQARIQRQQF